MASGLDGLEGAGVVVYCTKEVRRILKGLPAAERDRVGVRASLKDYYRVLKRRVKVLRTREPVASGPGPSREAVARKWTLPSFWYGGSRTSQSCVATVERTGQGTRKLRKPPPGASTSSQPAVALKNKPKKRASPRDVSRCVVTGVVVGGVAGCMTGAKIGAKFGAMVGGKLGAVVGGGVGMIVGGILGVIVGGAVGGWLGLWLR